MSYKIQHMGLGGILDQAIAVTKNHFGLLFTIMLLLLVPFNLINGFVMMAVFPDFMVQPSMEEMMTRDAAEYQEPEFPLGAILWLPAAGLIGFVVYSLTNAAVIQAVARLYLGQPVTATEAMKHALRRLLPLIGTTILMTLAIMGGFILLIIPGIIFMIWFALTQHVVVIEEIAGTKALGRSRKLVSPHWATALALIFIMAVIGYAVQIVSAFIPQPHLQMLVNTLVTAVFTIVATAAWVVFYFSCRCAVENFDLHYLAEQIGAETPDVAE